MQRISIWPGVCFNLDLSDRDLPGIHALPRPISYGILLYSLEQRPYPVSQMIGTSRQHLESSRLGLYRRVHPRPCRIRP